MPESESPHEGPRLADFPERRLDALPPEAYPEHPLGYLGFSHYVFGRLDGKIEPALIEGPRDTQVRCQSEQLPCSYLDLKALLDSGEEVPDSLRMTRGELSVLVRQLDIVAEHLAAHPTVAEACAEGYMVSSVQTPNMGMHLLHPGYLADGLFDLRKPEILLYAMDGGEKLTREQLGDCVDGQWTGDERHRIVAAAYMLRGQDFGDEHPTGFAGPFDNWHVHYHSCRGSRSDAILSEEACTTRGGSYAFRGDWMIHVYAVPEFDNQAGVFAMWNPQIWPRRAVSDIKLTRRAPRNAAIEEGQRSLIFNFRFEDPVVVRANEEVVFVNSDQVLHTVTGGKPGAPSGVFDSGDLYADGSFSVSFDEPGEYAFYCRYHDFMVGKVVVREATTP